MGRKGKQALRVSKETWGFKGTKAVPDKKEPRERKGRRERREQFPRFLPVISTNQMLSAMFMYNTVL
jgi:hypothetical protein